jgi:osomolarity two-component system response regulator SSK1
MDIQLPVMDGIEATKEIRKLEKMNNIGVFPSTPLAEQPQPLPQIRETSDGAPPSPFRSSVIIVALTASSLQSDRVVALAAGCNDFLTKPVSLKWLEKKIIEWGCMQASLLSLSDHENDRLTNQALIDFEGWKRWKGTDKDNTKQGFQLGPQRAARDIAGKLHIDRKGTKTPPAHAMSRQSSSTRPDIQVRSATPQSSLDAVTSPILDNEAANSLSAARSELAGRLPAPPGPDAASSVVPTTTETAHAARQLQQSALSAESASPTSPTSPPSSRPPKSRPTTPKQEGRISSSSSLHSIHEALEPSAVIRSEKERSPESPFDKPLPALPQGG